MRSSVLLPLFLALPAAAQDEIVHYKFDATDADRVLNFASDPTAAPSFGDTSWPAAQSYTSGRTGGALAASPFTGVIGNFVRTGWTGGHQGSLTIAFALQNRRTNSVADYAPIAGQPSWSLASGGSAGAGLQLRGVVGADLDADFGAPLCTMVGWQHFAVVVDAGAGSATWYRNGAAVSSTPVATPVALPVQDQLLVGTDYLTMCGSGYEFDDFRMIGRAATAHEIANWASATTPAVVAFGTAHATILEHVGTPAIGNAAFALRVTGVQDEPFVLAAGLGYESIGPLALPFDLATIVPGATGQLLVDPSAFAAGTLVSGEREIAMPVPAVTSLRGAAFYAQVITMTPPGSLAASNALAISIGDPE